MTWIFQFCQCGNHRLKVTGLGKHWRYEILWWSETGMTMVAKGSTVYEDMYEARHAAVLHLASILPKAQSKRLLAEQAELEWERWL